LKSRNKENSAVSEKSAYKVGHACIFRCNFKNFSKNQSKIKRKDLEGVLFGVHQNFKGVLYFTSQAVMSSRQPRE
jgi:hypothetical protein